MVVATAAADSLRMTLLLNQERRRKRLKCAIQKKPIFYLTC
jgi:hypothetical protein